MSLSAPNSRRNKVAMKAEMLNATMSALAMVTNKILQVVSGFSVVRAQ